MISQLWENKNPLLSKFQNPIQREHLIMLLSISNKILSLHMFLTSSIWFKDLINLQSVRKELIRCRSQHIKDQRARTSLLVKWASDRSLNTNDQTRQGRDQSQSLQKWIEFQNKIVLLRAIYLNNKFRLQKKGTNKVSCHFSNKNNQLHHQQIQESSLLNSRNQENQTLTFQSSFSKNLNTQCIINNWFLLCL